MSTKRNRNFPALLEYFYVAIFHLFMLLMTFFVKCLDRREVGDFLKEREKEKESFYLKKKKKFFSYLVVTCFFFPIFRFFFSFTVADVATAYATNYSLFSVEKWEIEKLEKRMLSREYYGRAFVSKFASFILWRIFFFRFALFIQFNFA